VVTVRVAILLAIPQNGVVVSTEASDFIVPPLIQSCVTTRIVGVATTVALNMQMFAWGGHGPALLDQCAHGRKEVTTNASLAAASKTTNTVAKTMFSYAQIIRAVMQMWMDGIAARSGGRTEILAPEIIQRCVDVWDVVATTTTVVALHAGSTNFSNAASEHQDFELRCLCSSVVLNGHRWAHWCNIGTVFC
jgi:hypothetical protein